MNTIKSFCAEGSSLPSAPNEIEIVLRQILNEVEELIDSTEAKLLSQNGKIAELVVYIKNNLSNSIRDLVDTMKATGELDNIITSAISNKMAFLEDTVFPLGHIKRYGAIGDGIADDTLFFVKACEDARNHNKPLIVDNGKYLISQDINAREIKTVNITGEIINDNCVFNVGGKSSDASGYRVDIRKIKNLKVSGLKNSVLNIDYCEKLHLFADANDSNISSTAYNQFYGAYCKEIFIEGAESENLSWINENVFRIKRVEIISFKGDYLHNNNRFEHINFEKGVLNIDGAQNNYFSARSEGGITVNTTDSSQQNFLEKEYYFRHYFGEDVTENNGLVSYYLVNKLQTETMLKQIDSNNRNFKIGSMYFNEDGTFTGNSFNSIYHSNLIPIDNTFALKIKSNAKNFRVQLNFYDENKNPIKTEVTNFADGKMSFINANGWLYGINSNVDSDTVTFYPGYAKYVEYHVLFGNNTTAKIDYLTIKLLKLTNTDINISNKLKDNVYTSLPSTGYWEQGKILYANSPRAGASIGVVCVESGVPGVWKNWGSVSV